jgi:hypothetical protein
MAPRENDFDPTTWPDELMDRMSTSLGQTGGRSMPQDWQRLKVTAEMKRRARLKADGKPTEPVARPVTNVDANLAAAATPIVLEPEAGGIEARHAVRVAELVRQGVPRQQAIVIAGREVVQEQSAEADARADARLESGYRDPRQTAYNAETFAEGYGFDDSGNPAHLGKVDIDNTDSSAADRQAARAYNARDPRGAEVAINDLPHPGRQVQADPPRPLGMTAPGPRTLDGRPPAPSRPLMTPEEVEAYDIRPPGGLSQRDRDMALRGFVPVVTPNGVSYMRAAGDTQTIGGPGRAGSRPDLLTKKKPEQQWAVSELGDYMGPDGKPVSVLVPGPQMLAKREADLEQRQAAYQAKKAANEADFEKRRAHRIALAKLAGGSQNINSGNRWMAEALLAMKPEERASSMRYMLPGGDRAAMVDARNMENSGEVIKRYLTAGAAGFQNTPATAMAVQQQKIAQRKEIIEWAEKNINTRYAYDSNRLGASEFTAAKRDQAIQDLMDLYGEPDGPLNLADATRIVDNIGKRKRGPAVAPPAGATAPSAGGADGGFTG